MPTCTTDGVETDYERRGEGPAVVFVHASVMDHALWDEQVAAPKDEYTMELYADDLHALPAELDPERTSASSVGTDAE